MRRENFICSPAPMSDLDSVARAALLECVQGLDAFPHFLSRTVSAPAARWRRRRASPGLSVGPGELLASAALVMGLWLLAGLIQAESFRAFGPATQGSGFEESFAGVLEKNRAMTWADLDLGLPALVGIGAAKPSKVDDVVPTEGRRPHSFWIGLVSFGVVAGSAYNSFWDGPDQKFHFTNEGFFGQNTYAGGADKASHFVDYYIVAKLLTGVYQELNQPVDGARLLGAGISALAGLVTELGDGRGRYGFSYEDFVLDALGAATSLGIAHYRLGDLIGFRAGIVPRPEVDCCPYGGFGKDYTEEIYAGDLKIAGLGQRAHFNPGPARFLLFSVTYASKGYPYSNPVVRERQIGLEVGLNFCEIMRAIGVPERTWWGKILYFAFDVIRIPYTQIGMYYDLNSGRWRGPGIGDSFPGGGP